MIRNIIVLCGVMLLIGCSKSSDNNSSEDPSESISTTQKTNPTGTIPASEMADPTSSSYSESEETVSADDEDMVENSTFSSVISINYSANTATVTGSASGVSVSTDGANVTINSSASEVEYILSGNTTNGSFKIYSSKKFKLTLSGLTLTNPSGATINIQSKKRNFLVLESTNTLTDGPTYTSIDDEDCKGTFFSEGQTIFSGSGSLKITANYKHGIANDQYIRIRKGVELTISSAAKDGIHTNEYVRIDGGNITVNASSDGIECEEGYIEINGGYVTVNSTDDAIVTSYDLTADGADTTIDPYINITNGKITLRTTGEKAHGVSSSSDVKISGGVFDISVSGNASKGIKSDKNIDISSGHLTIKTSGTGLYESSEDDISSSSGIKCSGNMTYNGATLYVTSTGTAGKGISVDGTLDIKGGKITIVTQGKQYIYNRLDSSPKGIKAEGNLTIDDGYISVKASGSEGSEGIESKATLTINGGTIIAECYDDCINASSAIIINGGDVYCYSSGNDGIDSNGTLSITGGLVISSGTTSPEEGFDCDQNRFTITGGTLIGTGGGTSTPTASSCTQRSVIYNGSATSGQYINIHDTSGASILTYKIPRSYNQMTLLFCSPLMKSSTTYYISSSVNVSSGAEWNGYYLNGNYSGGNSLTSYTTTNMVTTIGCSSGGMGGGGRP